MADLVEALKVERDARVKERLLAVKLVYDGFTLSRAAEAVVGRRGLSSIGLRGLGREACIKYIYQNTRPS